MKVDKLDYYNIVGLAIVEAIVAGIDGAFDLGRQRLGQATRLLVSLGVRRASSSSDN